VRRWSWLWLAALAATGARAQAPPDPDPWLGKDKAIHFALSAGIASGGYALAGLWRPSGEAQRLVVGGSAALAVGVAKELFDLATGLGTPSWKDLAWDAAGTAAGLAVAWAVDRFILQPLALQLRWVRVAGNEL
jgi:putative lipoprotein